MVTITKMSKRIITMCIVLFLFYSCDSQSKIKFPIEVGTKPESITKGFNNNYYVTIMNGKENGDGEIIEISKNGVNVFAKGFDEPKGIVFLNNHLYFSDLNRIWKDYGWLLLFRSFFG